MPTDRKIILSPRSRIWDRSPASGFATCLGLGLAVLTLAAHTAAQTVTDLDDFTGNAGERNPWTYTALVDFNKVSVGVNPAGVVAGEFDNVYATTCGGTHAPGNLISVVP
jgi:hypothetical protein